MTKKIPCILESELQDVNKSRELIDKLFQQAKTLVKESENWPILYRHGNIITRHWKKKDQSNKYLQRSSLHNSNEVTYDQLRSLLFIDHSINELKYMKIIEDAVLINKVTDEADIFWLGFKTPPLSANREFIELVATREEERQFMVVSQPIHYYNKMKKKGYYVRGAYQAWEIVKEKQDEQGSKVVEWTCIQHSSAGGLVPSFLSDWVAASDFHHDVELIINIYQKRKMFNTQL